MSIESVVMQVRPAKGQHAIETVAIGVDWAPPATNEVLSAAGALYAQDKQLQGQLPVRRAMPGFKFELDNQSALSISSATEELVDFVHLEPDGAADTTLSIRPQFFSCTSTVYPGWKSVKPRLLGLLFPFVRLAVDRGTIIQGFGLQFQDSFRWSKDSGVTMADVLRQDSGALAPAVFSRKSFWHSHQGWFTQTDSGHRLLNIVNVELVEEGPEFVLKISGQHRMQCCDLGGVAKALGIDHLETALDDLHKSNKMALHDLLTQTLTEMINLKRVVPS